jgi:hypothetical protein
LRCRLYSGRQQYSNSSEGGIWQGLCFGLAWLGLARPKREDVHRVFVINCGCCIHFKISSPLKQIKCSAVQCKSSALQYHETGPQTSSRGAGAGTSTGATANTLPRLGATTGSVGTFLRGGRAVRIWSDQALSDTTNTIDKNSNTIDNNKNSSNHSYKYASQFLPRKQQ